MKVLLVFSSGNIGGAERSLSRMAFNSKEIEYQLATMGGKGAWSKWIVSQGRHPLTFGGGGMLRGIWRLLRYVRHNEIDIVYVCGVRVSLYLRFLRFLMPGTKLVHGIRSNLDSGSTLDIFLRLMEKYSSLLVDAWIVNSLVTKQTLISRCRISTENIFVIYNGVNELPQSTLPLKMRPVEVLTVANLNPRKGHMEYLQVIKEVIALVPNVRFIFVGRDDMKGEIQSYIRENRLSNSISYEGFVEDVSVWYRRAQLFVLPSLWGEGCPTTILEAFSNGVPVVAYSVDGIPELVSNGNDGILAPAGCQSSLAGAVVELLNDLPRAQIMGESGKYKVNENFTVDACESQHMTCFEAILTRYSSEL